MFVDTDFMKESFGESNTVDYYKDAVLNIGLWKSEKDLFTKYFNNNDNILDIGCGAGRTTLGLYNMGYTNITGIDFIPSNINNAKDIARSQNLNINYQVGDATDLQLEDNTFNHAIFSFNGFMQIPQKVNRMKALYEIRRVLKPSGVFIFTSNDMRYAPDSQEFWKQEKDRWNKGQQDTRLHDFGDRIFNMGNRFMYMYFATHEEQIEMLNECGFKVLDNFNRNGRYRESRKVIKFCTDCRFWICQSTKLVIN